MAVDLEAYDPAPIAAWAAANGGATGWTRTASGRRVANGPFRHQAKRRSGRGRGPWEGGR